MTDCAYEHCEDTADTAVVYVLTPERVHYCSEHFGNVSNLVPDRLYVEGRTV
jgi:hypothetical protein